MSPRGPIRRKIAITLRHVLPVNRSWRGESANGGPQIYLRARLHFPNKTKSVKVRFEGGMVGTSSFGGHLPRTMFSRGQRKRGHLVNVSIGYHRGINPRSIQAIFMALRDTGSKRGGQFDLGQARDCDFGSTMHVPNFATIQRTSRSHRMSRATAFEG